MLLIASFLIATLPQQASDTSDSVSAGSLISRVIRHYYDAKSLAGTIKLVQSTKGVSLSIDTDIQFDRPDKFFLRQVRGGTSPKRMTTVSDGKYFSYDKPSEKIGPPRYYEAVTQHGYTQSIGEIFGLSALSCLDRSPVLDVLVGRRSDLEYLRARLGTMSVTKTTNTSTGKIYEIEGLYMDLPGEEPTGRFQITVTDGGDMLRFIKIQRYRVDDVLKETLVITSTWDVHVKVDVKTDPSLYNVRQ